LRLARGLRVPGELHRAARVQHRPVRRQVRVAGLARAASALARSRCSAISRGSRPRRPQPCSAAISRVRSIGKPYVSCSWNALSPGSFLPPGLLRLGDRGVEDRGARLAAC
jgi:hypothetical protein